MPCIRWSRQLPNSSWLLTTHNPIRVFPCSSVAAPCRKFQESRRRPKMAPVRDRLTARPMARSSVKDTFTAALDALIADVRKDRSILAALLCGSLSHDTVWAKSDIDLLLVTIDDSRVATSDIALYADGVNVHAMLVPRREFRRMVEGSLQNSFVHSFMAKGRLLYTHDETIARLCGELQQLGARDKGIQLLRAATCALPAVYKAHK